jgi:hypothetical protein
VRSTSSSFFAPFESALNSGPNGTFLPSTVTITPRSNQSVRSDSTVVTVSFGGAVASR